jgi:hypothetical protein
MGDEGIENIEGNQFYVWNGLHSIQARVKFSLKWRRDFSARGLTYPRFCCLTARFLNAG